MSRLIVIATLVAAALLATAAGALASWLRAGLPVVAISAMAVFAVGVLAGATARAVRRARAAERRGEGQSTIVSGLVRRLQDVETQLASHRTAIEHLAKGLEASRAAAPPQLALPDPSADDIAVLGALVGDLAGAVAGQEERLARVEQQAATQAAAASVPVGPPEPIPATPSATFAAIQRMLGQRSGAPTVLPPGRDDRPASPAAVASSLPVSVATPPPRPLLASEVGEAVAAGRLDLFLQPVVTLPQRRTRFYEAVPRLKAADGRLLPLSARSEVEREGLGGAFDASLVAAILPIAQRLAARGREVGLICRLSAAGLADPALVDALIAQADTPGLAASTTLLLDASVLGELSGARLDARRRLSAAGYPFGIGAVTSLRLDGPSLAAAGVRLVKVSAGVLLQAGESGADVHAADLRGFLARSDIELVGAEADSDGMVADLIDLDVRLAQGEAISAARPVRSDVAAEPAAEPPRAAPVRPAAQESAAAAKTLGGSVLQDALRKLQGQGSRAADAEQRRDANRQAWRALARPISSSDRR